MQLSLQRSRFTGLGFYLAVAALAVTVWQVQRHLTRVTFPPNEIISSSSDAPAQWQQLAVNAVSDSTALLTTLATALLGALGLLLVNRGRDKERTPPRHPGSAFLCAAGACVSLYFGYVEHLYLVFMISNQTFDAYRLVNPSYFQFYALLAGTFFLADFAFQDLRQEA
ncbi:MAG: hypothetical protein WBD46_01950 [Acidobacteriaceae bacterium]